MRQIHMALRLILALFLSSGIALAQSAQERSSSVPRVIAVTGVFQPADGQPPRAVETVTLALYAEPTGGAPLWQETQGVAVDAKGRYSLLLGATSADGIPAAILTAGARWLGTSFDRPGEVEGPRVQLTSVPYTLRAADADTLGGRPASAYVLAPTKDGETTTTSSANGSDPSTRTPQTVQTGTTNYLAKYVNTTDVGNSAVMESAGKVGIGTSNPLDSLHVSFTNNNGQVTGYAVQNLGTGYSGMLFYDQNGALGQFQGFNNVTHEYRINNIASNASINFMTGSTSRFTVAPNGNIGIGTTSPAAPVEVSNALSGGTANMWVTSYTNAVGPYYLARRARGTPGAPAAVQSGDGLSGLYGMGYGTTQFGPASTGGITIQAAQNFTDTQQGTSITFSTTSVNSATPAIRMLLDASGHLGIGTGPTLPVGFLEVSNAASPFPTPTVTTTSSFTGTIPFGSYFVGRKARGTAAAPAAVQNGDGLAAFTGGGYGATGFGGGVIGGGMVVSAAENWTDTAQGASLAFNTTVWGTNTASTKMTIDPFGDVGIGTTAPDGSLEVSRTGGDATMRLSSYANGNTNANPEYGTRFANGTSAAPTSVQSGNVIGAWVAGGYGATQFSDVNGGMGVIAQENWTDTAQGTMTAFLATPLGSNNPHLHAAILPSGNVALGDWTFPNPAPTAADKLQVFGDVRVGTTGTNGCIKNFAGTGIAGTCSSDRRLKKNITPFAPMLDKVTALQPVHYFWRSDEFPDRHFGNSRSYGLIAQDVEQVLPELVVTNADGYKAIDYSQLPLLTIQAVKELKAENDALKQRVAELDPLKQRVAELERLLTELLAKQR
jgi:trimeric autotransporter adhesin